MFSYIHFLYRVAYFYLFILSSFFAVSLLSPLPPNSKRIHTHTPCMFRALAFLKFHRKNLVLIVEEFITRMSFENRYPIESICACKV
jgi:hypothetical protein